MSPEEAEFFSTKDWIRHILKALEELDRKVEELQKDTHKMTASCPEHRKVTEGLLEKIEKIEAEQNILKGQEPNKKIDEHIKQGAGWRLAILLQAISFLAVVGVGLINWGKLVEKVDTLQYNQRNVMRDVQELKTISSSHHQYMNESKNRDIRNEFTKTI
jgi:hypothetical protein